MQVNGTMAVFATPRELIEAVNTLQASGAEILNIYSPIPLSELEESIPRRPSPVRWFTLFGCIAGGVFGLFLQYYSVFQFPLPVGGKPVNALSAFIVIVFELTILFGALAALLGLLLTARLPRLAKEPYHTGCSRSEFALVIGHAPSEGEAVDSKLRALGAKQVKRLDAHD